MKKCITLIASTSTWKREGIELQNKDAKTFYYKIPQEVFGEKEVSYEKIIANDDYTDDNIHCVVEQVNDDGSAHRLI